MAEANVEEFGILPQFVVTDHVKDLDAAGGGGADEEFVPLGRKLNALTNALSIECVKYADRFGGNI